MFQRFSLFALLLCALTLGRGPVAHAKENAAQNAGRRAIVAAQARIDRARQDRDIPAIMSYLADDFQFFSIARLAQDRETYGRIQTNFAQMSRGKASSMRVKTTVNNWQWRGPDAVVWTTTTLDAGRGPHSVSGIVLSREYWGKTARGWQLRQIVEHSGQLTIDGETAYM